MENQLIKTINESGLDKSKAQILLDNFSNYFDIASEWEKKANELIVNDVNQIAEMRKAREGRLFLKQKRVDVEHTRKQLKENALREGQTIDAIAKILTNLIAPIENNLEQKEKFAELMEAQRKAEIKAFRETELQPYSEFIPYGIDLANMKDEDYAKLLNGAKFQLQAKFDAEKKAEEERIEREKAEAIERERIRVENERLRKEAEEREKELAVERAKAEAERKAVEDERKRLEEITRKEREESEAKLKAEQEAARKAAEKADEEKRMLQAEIRKKEEAEAAAKKAEQDRLIAEEKERRLAEKKAAAAPDKTKLLELANLIDAISKPALKTDEAIKILNDASVLLLKVSTFIREKSNTL